MGVSNHFKFKLQYSSDFLDLFLFLLSIRLPVDLYPPYIEANRAHQNQSTFLNAAARLCLFTTYSIQFLQLLYLFFFIPHTKHTWGMRCVYSIHWLPFLIYFSWALSISERESFMSSHLVTSMLVLFVRPLTRCTHYTSLKACLSFIIVWVLYCKGSVGFIHLCKLLS